MNVLVAAENQRIKAPDIASICCKEVFLLESRLLFKTAIFRVEHENKVQELAFKATKYQDIV